jgi:hypothetical protein
MNRLVIPYSYLVDALAMARQAQRAALACRAEQIERQGRLDSPRADSPILSEESGAILRTLATLLHGYRGPEYSTTFYALRDAIASNEPLAHIAMGLLADHGKDVS